MCEYREKYDYGCVKYVSNWRDNRYYDQNTTARMTVNRCHCAGRNRYYYDNEYANYDYKNRYSNVASYHHGRYY